MVILGVGAGLCLFVILMNAIYIRTPLFRQRVEAVERFRHIRPDEKFDIMNTGSNYAWYGLDYVGAGVKGLNLASGAQSFEWDERLLRRYLPQLRSGMPILIGLAYLVFCFTRYADDRTNARYYRFMPMQSIPNATWWKKIKYDWLPILGNWRNFVHCFYHRGARRAAARENTLANAQAGARERLGGWAQQFSLPGFQTHEDMAHLRPEIDKACVIVQQMVDMAKKAHHPVVFLVIPVSSVLQDQLGEEFLDAVLWEPVKQFKDVTVLNYMNDERFMDYHLYQNADFLNEEGRQKFTAVVLEDLQRLQAEGRLKA